MGQYFNIINTDKKQAFGCSAKLMEFAFNGCGLVSIMANLLSSEWKADHVYVVGDYGDETAPEDAWYDEYNRVFHQLGGDPYHVADNSFKWLVPYPIPVIPDRYFIINDKRKQFVDTEHCPISDKWEYDGEKGTDSVSPLVLLLSMSNGSGGSYYGLHQESVGLWAGDTSDVWVSFSKEAIPKGYAEFCPDFTEKSVVVPWNTPWEQIA